jgi:hypothetical protein
VIAVQRIPFTKNGVKLLSHTWEITFASSTVPNKLKVGFLALSVAPYIPNRMRCFKCQLFGHHQGYCKRDAVCNKCGKQDHDDKTCTQDPCCVNFKGSHPAYSKDCPKWKEEKEICRIKVMSNVSFKEARQIVLEQKNTPVEGKSYANASPPNKTTAVLAVVNLLRLKFLTLTKTLLQRLLGQNQMISILQKLSRNS